MVEPDAFIDNSLENFKFRTGTSYSTRDLNPVSNRLQNSGLLPGGRQRFEVSDPASINVQFQDSMQSGYSNDWKVRISVGGAVAGMFSQGVMAPLADTNGVIFPYTPDITIAYNTNYSTQRFTHSNFNQLSYENSEVSSISINADFTAQSKSEANYILACIYFFRTATKMFFGQDSGSASAGNPPVLVFLDGYGEHIFKRVPCVITQFNHTLPNDVDYIETSDSQQSTGDELGFFSSVSAGGTGTRIPTVTKLNVVLQPVYSKRSLAQFNLEDFARGGLVNRGYI
jgi:hypothetical protein